MSDFLPAYEATMLNEGGYVLHNVPGDRGGQTYAGIARNRWPSWPGWAAIDAGGKPDTNDVRHFYRTNFWAALRLDELQHQATAAAIYDFAVNAGPAVAVKLAQLVVGATPDGRIGPVTLQQLNAMDPDRFVLAYALAKLARYRDIVQRDRGQAKFLLGWINRTLKGVTA
jgi:lysozyme family protein